jgi:predicted outer membrane repeat protein
LRIRETVQRFSLPPYFLKTKFSLRPAAILLAAVSFLLFGAQAFSQTILYVNQAASGGSHNGSSWVNAFTKLEDAISAANPTASQPVEIWVAKGTYKPTTGTDRNAAYTLKSYLIIRGGFRGDETSLSQRTPYGTQTVLSGDIGTPMVGAISAEDTAPLQAASTSDAGWDDNCYNVIVGQGVTGVILDFLTITGGSATNAAIDRIAIDGYETYADDPTTPGAKSAVEPSSTVVGGGLFFTTGANWSTANYGLQMYYCTFARNRSRGYGGAVGLHDSAAYIGGCVFEDNQSDGPGGALWGLNQQSGFVACSFSGNSSKDGGGAVKLMGIPSERASNGDVDGFNDALRGVAFSIFGVADEKSTQDRIGSVLSAYGVYKAAGTFAATEGGFFTKFAATIPNPFAKTQSTYIKGISSNTTVTTEISPGARVMGAYAVIQLGFAAANGIVKIIDAFGKLDKNSADYKRWELVNDGFNKYATPQGLIALATHAALDAALPAAQPDLISAKKAGFNSYTQAGRSAFASCSFTGNRAENEGGAIELVFNNLLVEDCTFEKNIGVSNGGAISSAIYNMPEVISSVFANNASDGTSAISNNFNSLMMIVNCTIINNKSNNGKGKALSAAMGGDVRVYNSILWNNQDGAGQSGADVEATTEADLDDNARKTYNGLQGERVNWLGIMDIRNSIVQSLNTISLGTDSIAPRLSGTNLSQSDINAAVAAMKEADARGELESSGAVNVGAGVRPKLRDPAYGNSAADPLLLASPRGKTSAFSPANNTGNNNWINWKMISHATDLANIMDVAGQARIQNSRVDIGAYEVDNTKPDSAPLAGANVEAGVSDSPELPDVDNGPIPTVSPQTPPGVVVYYVKPTAAGDGSGSSWENATSDLGSAMSHPNAEVRVAAGTYKPTSGTDRTISFALAEGVKVFGGFAGNETTRAARNWKGRETILSGDIGAAGVSSDNSKNLFKNVGVGGSSQTVLDGFILQDAYSTDADGGAILNTNSTPFIQNCVFRNNHARNGGAIFSTGTGPVGSILFNCQFRTNSAEVAGGALRYENTLFGQSLTFSGNTAGTSGGAISVQGNSVGQYCTIQNGLFTENSSAAGAGGAIASSGLYLTVVNSTFYGNTATVTSAQRAGGGAIDDSYVPTNANSASAFVLNSIFYKNTVANSGAGGVQTVEKQQVQSTSLVLSHSLLQGVSTYANPLNANFSGDPQFVVEGADFHLKDTSLAIDSGDAPAMYTQAITADLDGNSRLINGKMDLGPYEHTATAAHPAPSVAETANGTDSYTFAANYTAATGDTLQWYVDRGDGRGYVPLAESDENQGTLTATLTVGSRPNGYSYRLQVIHNGLIYLSPSSTLEPTAASIAKYVYVKPVATGDGSGSSWANAMSDLRDAASRTGVEVWVAAGTYTPTSGTDRDASFSLGDSAKVYGGFLGNETKLSARDWRTNKSIISGEIGGSGVEDNSRHLFRNTDVNSYSALDGFYFQDAYADGADGGAILNVNSKPEIRNCVFQSNHARNGGAIASTGTTTIGFGSKLFNCEFRGNSADLNGGAVNFDGSWMGASLLFKDNTAQMGGAIYSTGDSTGRSCTVQSSLFTGNLATAGPGGAAWASGSSLYLINSTLYGNQATVNSASPAAGGAVYFEQGTTNIASLGIYNSIFYKNNALNAGSGGRASVEKQQISIAAGSYGGVKSSLIQGLQIYSGNGNFDGDPLFVQEGTNFHVSSSSPTVESGTLNDISSRLETTDLDGNDRIVGAIDLGPYEQAAPPSNPIRKITAASAGVESYSYTATDYSAQPGDVLRWQVDRGDGLGFRNLAANDPGDETLPPEYLGLNTASLTVLSPPSGFLFRLQLVRGVATYYSGALRLNPTEISKASYVYVRTVATGDGSGTGWANATSDLQAAISTRNAQVWVQQGVYYPTSGTDRDASFSLTAPGVRVYGGFKGTESILNARKPTTWVTRISGNIGSASSALDNSRHLFKNQDTRSSVVLDGLSFENAYADGEDGGAILNINACPTIQNCVFRNNYARNGGAIASTGTPPGTFGSDLPGCKFENNTAALLGGAISYSTSLAADNVIFKGNKASAGGAINMDGSLPGGSFTVRNGLFSDNQALSGQGGAIFSKGLYLNIQNSTFYGNQATLASSSPLGGGAIYQDFTSPDTYTVQVYNSIFYGNSTVNSGSGGRASLEYQQIAVQSDRPIYASHSLIQGLDLYANIAELGNFDEDPQFVDISGGAIEDFHLSDASPAINSGVASDGGQKLLTDTDLDGNARVVDTVDLGPYEYAGKAALGRVTTSTDFAAGTLRFFQNTSFAVQSGDTLQWYVDRGDGAGFVPLNADGVYSGVNSTSLSITSPPSSANGYIFRLQVVRGGTTLTTLSTKLTLPRTLIYVDADRLDMTADGAGWSTAYGSLADALKASGPGTSIWVAEGTYLPTSGKNTDAAFQIPEGVSVYGGFRGSESSLTERSPSRHPSILSGKLNGATARTDYSRHVVWNSGTQSRAAQLDGFILQDAYSSLMLNDGASPTVRNCIFQNNDSSRAADGYGAAISNLHSANPLIAECQFLGNTAVYGGALYFSGANATVENSLFASNIATGSGGAISARRGTLSLVQCTVADNTSQGTAAALDEQDSTVTVRNSIVWNNRTSYAGWSTFDQAFLTAGGSLTFDYSCVAGGSSLPATNLTYNPIFDATQGSAYALASYSPLVNAGSASYTVSSTTDLAGLPRVRQSVPDMGAYELQVDASTAVPLYSVPRSTTTYNIGGSVDFTLSWPTGTTVTPTWYLFQGSTPLDPSRYTIIGGDGFSTVRVNNLSLADTGLKVSFTDYSHGILVTTPAILTVKEPRIVRVNPAATGNNDGTSWNDAYTDISTALNNAQTADEIWVVAGTYSPTSGSYFDLSRTVTLLGGFLGTETARTDRDPVNHPTILHAVGSNPVLRAGTLNSDLDSGVSTTVDGFIVENSTGPATVYLAGVSPTFRRCIFRNNAGYLGNFQSQVNYDQCEFTGNTANLFIIDRSQVTLSNSSIHDNTTVVDLIGSSNNSAVTFTDTVVTGNTVAGALFRNSNGAAGGTSLTVLRDTFRGNTTGGAVIANGPGATVAIESSLFARNIASGDFATIQNSGTLTMNFSTVADNRGGSFGGGLATYAGSTSTINNSIFWGNRGTRASATLLAQQTGDSAGTDGAGTVTIARSFIEGIVTPLTAYNPETNMGFYPLFANPVTGDYHLPANSPAATTAPSNFPLLSATDLDKVPRRNGYGAVGAYESPSTLGTPLLISTYPASVTTAETTDASFTYVGQGSKQWQYFDGTNWVNISANTSAYRIINDGATQTSTLYFDSPSSTLDGTRYRLVITLGGVAYTSGDLVLTVKKPRILYVNGGAASSGNGGSWATAFKTIQEALAATDEYSEIWVEAGNYAINTAYITWKAHLYGGFAGNETQRSRRDWAANEVTLIGGGKQIFVSADSTASRKDKTSDAVIDGFTLIGSTAQAAVYLSNSDTSIANCTFRGNGSAIAVSGASNPTIANCVFDAQTGGALFLEADTASITGCTFQNNASPADSIVYIQRGKVTITASNFTGNTAKNGVVFTYSDADAATQAYVMNSTVTHLTMTRCRLTGNTAYAGLYSVQSLVDLDNSLLAQNTLTSSAVLDSSRSVINLTNVDVVDNTGTFECVGVQSSSTLNLANSILWGNRTSWPYGQAAHPGAPAAAILEYNQIKFGSNNVIKNSIVEGGYNVTYGANPNANSAYDPLFVDPATLNYQLTASSPAIDAGINGGAPYDIDTQPRTVGTTTDVGAYEFAGTPGTSIRVISNLAAKTLVAGQGIQFSATVPDGVNVQWQVKSGATWGNVVPGGSQALSSDGKTLTLSNVQVSMTGSQYRYVLSGDVSYTSPGAVLTVVAKPVIYVDANATGNRDGTSWANAYVTLDPALTAASNPLTGGPREVWVAQGTYVAGQYSLSPGVELYGGFAGGEIARSSRDIQAHPTIFTGGAGRDFRSYLLSDGYPDPSKSGIVIDGFTLTGATSGVYVSKGPGFVRNCTFVDLQGGGIVNYGGPLTVEDSTFTRVAGTAVLGSPASVSSPASDTTIRRSTFQNGSGLGVSSYLSNLTIEDCVFQNNTNTSVDNYFGNVFMTRCRVVNNQSADAINSRANNNSLNIRQTLIAGNSGTGLDTDFSAALVSVTIARNNIGIARGSSSALTLINSIVAENSLYQIYDSPNPSSAHILSANYSLVQGRSTGNSTNLPWSPQFTNSAAGDYTLAPRSPGVDTGTAAYVNDGETDLAGNTRIQSSAPDMGAYESAYTANPLYITALPASLATTRGVDGVFTISGASTYTYTWQYFNGSTWVDITYDGTKWVGPNGVTINITSANGVSSLTLPGTPLNTSGLQFRAIIDGQGITTAPVTLTVSEPEIMYIDGSVAASGDGKSWATAYKTLSEVTNPTSLFDPKRITQARRIVYVAEGTYLPKAGSRFEISQRAEIYGGFPAGGGAFAARNPAVHPVILSGELGDPASMSDNAYPVVYINALNSPIDADTIIDGVTIDRGLVGVWVTSNAKPTLRNVVISHNTQNGLRLESGGGRFENCQFLENTSNGGASISTGNVTFSGCSFRGNTMATSGGALAIYSGSVRIESCVISGNQSGNDGGGIAVLGGSNVLVNSTVVGNSTAGYSGGGGISLSGGGLAVWNSIVWANRSTQNPNSNQPTSIKDQQLSGGFDVQASDIEGLTPSGTNISADPLFVSVISAASAPTTTGDFHIYGGSPAQDAGNDSLVGVTTLDADGSPRSVRTVDMGAYEVQGSASDPLVITQQPADLVIEGQGANEFHVGLTGTNYTYQWESATNGVFTPVVDGADFAGAQTDTLQVVSRDPDLSGTVFRVKVSAASGGQITSRIASLAVYPSRYYVNGAAADDNGKGTTWATAFKTVGTALAKARVNPTSGVEIWVTGGTYTTSATDTTASFPLKSKMAIYGGFTGTETALGQRDVVAHPTTLIGLAGSTAVFAKSGTTAFTNVRIDGFAISNAATGIAMGQNVALSVANCSFSGLGTGISGDQGTLTVQNSQFSGAAQYGIYVTSTALSVADSVFTTNGQGLVQGGGSLSLVRSSFRGNGAPGVSGGGLKTTGVQGSVENCLFSGNYAQYGGATYSQGNYGSTFNFRNCTVAGNFATDGAGAIYFTGASSDAAIGIYNTIVWGNDSDGTYKSNYIYAVSYKTILTNNYFQPNAAGDPLFVAPVAASVGGTTAGDYHLRPLSFLINQGGNSEAGSSATDLAQAPRIVESTVDIGAYELQVIPLRLTSQPANTFAGFNIPGSFSVTSNNANASYQWQVSTDGGVTWTNVVDSSSESGAQTSTLTLGSFPSYNGRLYRVHVITTDSGDLYTNAVTYTYLLATVQPPTGVRDQMLTGRTSTAGFKVIGNPLPASILDGSFAVHGSQTGRLTLADGSLTGFTITGDTVTFQSAVPFKAGESVEVTTTGGVQRADGYTASPMVYQFRAGSQGSYGVFPFANAITGAPATATALASGDVDGDGTVDLVIGGTNGAKVWLNNGTASFTPTSQTLGSGTVSQVLVGSLGFSNKLDVVLRKSNGDVEIWRNDGDGTFTKTSTIAGLGANSLGLADLNGDGTLDLFIATAGADQVWFNSGAGVFTDSGQRLGTGGAGLSVAFGGYADSNSLSVFVANGSETMEIWKNDGTGHFTAGPVTFGGEVNRVIVADFDRDGSVDLIGVRNNGQIRIFRQYTSPGTDAYRTFQYLNSFQPVGLSPSDPTGLAVADLDNDGYPDLVFHDPYAGTTEIWKGQGYDSSNGRMAFQQITEQPTLPLSKALDLVDLNGDGMMDFVFISVSGVPTVALYAVPPIAPTGLTATKNSDTRITLAWTDNATTETGYTVERSPDGNNNWTVIAPALPANTTGYIDTGRNPATPYYYRVRCNIGGALSSAYSNTASTSTAAAIGAVTDSIAMLENATATTLAGGASSVLANDSNPDGGTLTAAVVTSPTHGSLTLNGDGSFSYTPATGFSGSDSFTYRATNSATTASAVSTVTITVTRLNDAPSSLTFTPVAGTRYTGQAAGLAIATLSATDPDPEDAGQLTFSLVSGTGSTDNADFTIVGNTLETATVIDASAGLTRSVLIRVTDSMGASREQSFLVTFVQAPTATAAAFSLDEDAPLELLLSGAGGASDLSYQIVNQPGHGTLTLSTTVSGANAYIYTPDANYNGTDSFTYRVADGTLDSAPVTVTFTVAPVDDAPTLDAVAPVTTIENTPVSFTLVGHDVDGDAITSYQLASTPAFGTVQINGSVVTYTPNTGVIATETLKFTVTAGSLTSAPLLVDVTTAPEPVALTVYRGLYAYSDIPAASTGDWTGVLPTNVSTPSHGTVALEGSRLLYKHNGDSAVSDRFTYTLSNGSGAVRHVGVDVSIGDRVIDVTSANDSGPGSLRAAIDITNKFVDDAILEPAYTKALDWLIRIQTDAGTVSTLTSATDYGVALGFYSYFRIAGNVTVDAAAVPGYILNTGGSHRARHFLVLSDASLTLKHLVLNNGEANDRTYTGTNAAPISHGGDILNFGTFNAQAMNFRNSRAGEGAAIYNDGGTIFLSGCVFQGNFIILSSDPGGIVVSRNGSLRIEGSSFTGNTGNDGGDLTVTGDGALATVNVSDSTIDTFHLNKVNDGTLAVTGLLYAQPDEALRVPDQQISIPTGLLFANDSGSIVDFTFDAVSAAGVPITRSGNNLFYGAAPASIEEDTFNYTITDDSGHTSTATVTVSLPGDPYPHGNADSATVYRGLYEDINVLANDTDDRGHALTISAVSTPAHGTATIQNGRIHYINDGSSSDTDSFTYSISNGTKVTENITVTISIAGLTLDATNGADSGPGTLRAALTTVNRFAGTAPQWTIRILAGSDQTWTLDSTTQDNYPDYRSAFKISGNVLIDATGSPNFTLAAPDNPTPFGFGRLFLVQSGARLELKNLTLAKGRASSDEMNFQPTTTSGGAILNRGVLSATGVNFRNNIATQGAALYNDGGTVTLNDCIFSGNQSYSPFGGYDNLGIVASVNGTLNLVDVSIDDYVVNGTRVSALYVSGGTLNHSSDNHIASYQSSGSVNVVPGLSYAVGETFSRVAGKPLRIAISSLLANDVNPVISTFAFDGTSSNGVTITRSGDFLLFHAPANDVGDGTFNYTLTDSLGQTTTATVTVQELERTPTVAVTPRNGGGVVVSLKGVPNTAYHIQASNDLVNWSDVVIEESFEGMWFYEIYTDGGGNATWEDHDQPDPGTSRFYRAERYNY